MHKTLAWGFKFGHMAGPTGGGGGSTSGGAGGSGAGGTGITPYGTGAAGYRHPHPSPSSSRSWRHRWHWRWLFMTLFLSTSPLELQNGVMTPIEVSITYDAKKCKDVVFYKSLTCEHRQIDFLLVKVVPGEKTLYSGTYLRRGLTMCGTAERQLCSTLMTQRFIRVVKHTRKR